MNIKSRFLAMAMMAEMMESASYPKQNKGREFIPFEPREPKQQPGTFHYWFRDDGSFLTEKQGERMRKDECVFVCFSMNDKNAIKKFNKYKNDQNSK